MKPRPVVLLLLSLLMSVSMVPFMRLLNTASAQPEVAVDTARVFPAEVSRSAAVRLADVVTTTTSTTVPRRTTTTRKVTTTVASRPRPVATPVAPKPKPVVVAGTDVWAKLRMCEAGGSYTRNTGNGFYGAYQFMVSTWRATLTEMAKGNPERFGPWVNVMPHRAPPDIQDAAARAQHAVNGWKPWPACSRKLGLR